MPHNFTALTMPQRTPEWFAARAGVLTASRAADFLATLKSKGEAASRRNLRVQLVVERLTGRSVEDGYINAAMQHGIDTEAEARGAYEAATGELVSEVGFLRHNTLPIGCSPDGVIGDYEGGVEIKCPAMATHLEYLRGGVCPPEYKPQITHTLFITGAPWWDFVSYDNRWPEELRLFVVRVKREDVDLSTYEVALRLFLLEVDKEEAEVMALLRQKRNEVAA